VLPFTHLHDLILLNFDVNLLPFSLLQIPLSLSPFPYKLLGDIFSNYLVKQFLDDLFLFRYKIYLLFMIAPMKNRKSLLLIEMEIKGGEIGQRSILA
jgi:hypothetical protein